MEAEAEATHSSLVPQKHNDLFIVRGHMTYRNANDYRGPY